MVNSEGKPAVACINGCHTVTLTKEENGCYVFKNSYGKNDPNNPPWIKIPISLQPDLRIDFKLIHHFFKVGQQFKSHLSSIQGQTVVYDRFVGLTIGAKLKCGVYIVS